MSRITTAQRKIALAHLDAYRNKSFDFTQYPEYNGMIDMHKLRDELLDGKTYEPLFTEVEARCCSVGSSLLQRMFDHQSQNYKASIYKGFKVLLAKVSIA